MIADHHLSELVRRRQDVAVTRPEATLSAHATARCLSGVVNLVCRQWSVDVMQSVCATLALSEPSWSSKLAKLPHLAGENVHPAVEMIAVVARGILPLAGEQAMRSALSWWATESDPHVWQQVAGLAA